RRWRCSSSSWAARSWARAGRRRSGGSGRSGRSRASRRRSRADRPRSPVPRPLAHGAPGRIFPGSRPLRAPRPVRRTHRAPIPGAMDNLTHSLAGAALAATGLRRTTPLATATLVLAANAPDVDAFVYLFGDSYDGLAFRRGWTHGPIAMAVLPFVVAAVILGWDRWLRRRQIGRAACRDAMYLAGLDEPRH